MNKVVRVLLQSMIRLLFGVRKLPSSCLPDGPFILFANHASHVDTLALWTALPEPVRKRTRPVAAVDYWGASAWRRFVAEEVLNALLIARKKSERNENPIDQMLSALDAGDALILFPEGTRSKDGTIAKFKAGLYKLHKARPEVPLVPAFLHNPGRALPKGKWFPVPLLCEIRMGAPMALDTDVRNGREGADAFLQQAYDAVRALAGDQTRTPEPKA